MSTKHQALGTEHPAPSTRHRAPSTKHSAPSTLVCIFMHTCASTRLRRRAARAPADKESCAARPEAHRRLGAGLHGECNPPAARRIRRAPGARPVSPASARPRARPDVIGCRGAERPLPQRRTIALITVRLKADTTYDVRLRRTITVALNELGFRARAGSRTSPPPACRRRGSPRAPSRSTRSPSASPASG